MLAALALAGCGGAPSVDTDSAVALVRTRQLVLSTQPARELAFSPDGRTLATSAAGGTVRPGGPEAEDAMFVAWGPDGKWVATATEGGTATLWRLMPRGHPVRVGAQTLSR